MKKTNKHGDRWIYTPVIVQVAMVYGPFIVDLPIQIRVFVFFWFYIGIYVMLVYQRVSNKKV